MCDNDIERWNNEKLLPKKNDYSAQMLEVQYWAVCTKLLPKVFSGQCVHQSLVTAGLMLCRMMAK